MRLFSTFVFVALLSACSLFERQLTSSVSPDGRSKVAISELPHGADSAVYIHAQQGTFKTTLEYLDDLGPYFPEIYWSNTDTFGAFVCNAYGYRILTAYSFSKRERVPVTSVESGLVAQIRQKYSPPEDALQRYKGDVLTWRCQNERDSFGSKRER